MIKIKTKQRKNKMINHQIVHKFNIVIVCFQKMHRIKKKKKVPKGNFLSLSVTFLSLVQNFQAKRDCTLVRNFQRKAQLNE